MSGVSSIVFEGVLLRCLGAEESILCSAKKVIPRFIFRRKEGLYGASVDWRAVVNEVFSNDHSECEGDIVAVLIACGILADESAAGYMVVSPPTGQIKSMTLYPAKRTVFVLKADVKEYVRELIRLYGGSFSVFRKEANIRLP